MSNGTEECIEDRRFASLRPLESNRRLHIQTLIKEIWFLTPLYELIWGGSNILSSFNGFIVARWIPWAHINRADENIFSTCRAQMSSFAIFICFHIVYFTCLHFGTLGSLLWRSKLIFLSSSLLVRKEVILKDLFLLKFSNVWQAWRGKGCLFVCRYEQSSWGSVSSTAYFWMVGD